MSYAGAVYRLPHIYRSGGRSVSFRFVSFRSSPNNFCTATKAPLSLSLSRTLFFLFPFRLLRHPSFISFFFSLSHTPSFARCAPSPLSLSLALLFVRSSFVSAPDICPDCNCRGLFPTRFPCASACTRPSESSLSLFPPLSPRFPSSLFSMSPRPPREAIFYSSGYTGFGCAPREDREG